MVKPPVPEITPAKVLLIAVPAIVSVLLPKTTVVPVIFHVLDREPI